jgi:hypothetical protein
LPLILWESEGFFLSFNLLILNLGSSIFYFVLFPLFYFLFSLILYFISICSSSSIPIAFESIESLFFCMNRYYSIPISSRYLPRKIPNCIQNWRVSVSLSMRLCTLQIGINLFLKDPGFRALVSRPRSFQWPMLCWRDIYMIRSIA